ncbi:MAG: hypothetical protein U0T77_11445 [Chitinophagales bacterium]
MKTKSINKIIIAVVLVFGFTGCYKDVISPGTDPNGPPMDVSFSGDLVPLFTANCATAGCHDGVAHKPDLRADKAYNAITGGGYVNTLVPGNSILYTEVKTGSMPPTGALTAKQAQLILDWVRNGAPNN